MAIGEELLAVHDRDGEGIATAIGKEVGFEVGLLLDREARDERLDLGVDGELVGGLVSAIVLEGAPIPGPTLKKNIESRSAQPSTESGLKGRPYSWASRSCRTDSPSMPSRVHSSGVEHTARSSLHKG